MEYDQLYQRSNRIKDSNRTFVPDMYRQEVAEMQAEEGTHGQQNRRTVTLQPRPIVGVLYSISDGVEGELFPIYVGRNTVGSDANCDISLRETSVSAMHGLLLARKQTNVQGEEYLSVTLADNNSNYGTTVNGERLGYDKVTLADGDIVTVGQNYVLAVQLFKSLDRLSVAYAFDRLVEEQPAAPEATPETELPPVPQPPLPVADHSTNITVGRIDSQDDAGDFYKPSKPVSTDHYNNKTIIL